MKIKSITAREILDSRGNPTVEAKVVLENGVVGFAQAPSGVSAGVHEAVELRDGGQRYGGKGVLKAVKNVNTVIAASLGGARVDRPPEIDGRLLALDGTKNKSALGANAILAVSLASARAGALTMETPLYRYLRAVFKVPGREWRLPLPMIMIIEGGRHADSGLTVQEFLIIPRHRLLRERVRMGSQIFHALGNLLSQKGFSTTVGDEGGYAAELVTAERALQFMVTAIRQAGWQPGRQVYLALDVAASEFYRRGQYYLASKKQGWRSEKMIATLAQWAKGFPLFAIEDGLSEDDWDNWRTLTRRLGKKVLLVGDDIFATNVERLQRGITEGIANALVIKPNQAGTLTETMATIALARAHGYQLVISHRAGDTADTFIADLAVAVNAEFIKTSISRAERTEKYNRLMEIELELGL